jgi:hypothetical protein
MLDWGQSCSKLPADGFSPNDTRLDRTIQDHSRTFQQAHYAELFLNQIIVEYLQRAAPQFEYPGGICCVGLEAAALANGELSMKKRSLWMIAAICFVAPASVAHARSAYDGSWDLAFVTQRGACDPSYNFTVNVSDGVVTHPNLVRFKGYVAKSGSVHASVTVQDKFASGTGRLFGTSGRGTWNGRAGSARCSGYWTAQRN